MKKSFMGITVALLVAAFTVSAWAGYRDKPAGLRNQAFSGFGIQFAGNQTGAASEMARVATVYNSTALLLPSNSTGINATIGLYNTAGAITTINWRNSSAAVGYANNHFRSNVVAFGQVPGTFYLGNFNRSSLSTNSSTDAFGHSGFAGVDKAFYNFIAAPDYSMVVGVSNHTFRNNATATNGANATSKSMGANMMVWVPQNAATLSTTYLAGTWNFYTVLINPSTNKTSYRAGQMVLPSGGATTARVKLYDGRYGTTNSTALSYKLTVTGRNLRISNGTAWTAPSNILIENGTVSADNKTIVGISVANGIKSITVAMKGAVTMSSSDLANRYMKVVSAGQSNKTGGIVGNSNSTFSLRAFLPNDSLQLTTGNSTTSIGGGMQQARNLAGMTISLGSRSLAGVSHSNFTLKSASSSISQGKFLGTWSSNKKFGVGIWNNTSNAYSLMFIFPTAATTGNFSKALATTTYWGNTTLGAATVVRTISSTAMTDAMLTRYNLSGVMPVTEMKSFNATAAGSANRAANLFTGTYTAQGLAGNINNLRLYKLNNATRATSLFNRVDTRSITDGSWWIEQATGQAVDAGGPIGSGTVIGTNSILDPTVVYNVYFVIRQGGSYNLGSSTAANFAITDPQFIGQIIPGGSSSSSSSTGCTFNPSAGFGLEWLLLLIAPAIGILRSRFKK